MKIAISRARLAALDMAGHKDLIGGAGAHYDAPERGHNAPGEQYVAAREFFCAPAGREQYRLIAALSESITEGKTIVDLGTLYGSSALAASMHPGRRVISYEIAMRAYSGIPEAIRKRGAFFYRDGCAAWAEWAGDAGLVILDVEPHDGVQEAKLVRDLDGAGWAGIMLCDDIALTDGMKEFWAGVPEERKWDVTEIGHWSGSGIIGFGGWTFATTD